MNAFPDDTFLGLVPAQAVEAEPGEGDTVVLIRPKILSPRWAWLLKLMKRPHFRVKLDARGTALWRACDSARTVAQVMEAMARAHPGEADAGFRAALFLRELARGGFVRLS
ncbi:PqqD family peptide modification chaperone [Geothrix fermentans]|uniref:PqqD family peptide modification chaperone n=1 Tax=Geothrix fermentans TaxID=44676 RepID=UPI000413DC2C|nr:PqqD family peptide modification chaperone [Geothrix fermentans]